MTPRTMQTTVFGLAMVVTLGCSGSVAERRPDRPLATDPTRARPAEIHLAGRVRIPSFIEHIPFAGLHADGREEFAGVLLEADDATVWVVSDRTDDLWNLFNHRRVLVEGERVPPRADGPSYPHIEAHAWRVERIEETTMVAAVGPVEEIVGSVSHEVAPRGQKDRGEHYTILSTNGLEEHVLMNAPRDEPIGVRSFRVRRVKWGRVQLTGRSSWLWIVARE
jgi:hypothetical protein